MTKKILILGATGMMGSTLSKLLKDDNRFNILCTYKDPSKIKFINLKKNQKKKLNVIDKKKLKKIIVDFNPDYIVNCVGLIKQLFKTNSVNLARYLNSSFPKILMKTTKQKKTKILHLSTDCVFSGKKGNYNENDKSDALDFYGKSKFEGEVKSKNVLNIRTSIIGNEISSKHSLLNWFLSKKKISGYKKAYFSGLTTLELSYHLIEEIILKKKISNGLFHISGPKISKFELLKIIKKIYKKKTIIKVDNSFKIDRSLNSTKYRKIVKTKIKSWPKMINELKNFNENF